MWPGLTYPEGSHEWAQSGWTLTVFLNIYLACLCPFHLYLILFQRIKGTSNISIIDSKCVRENGSIAKIDFCVGKLCFRWDIDCNFCIRVVFSYCDRNHDHNRNCVLNPWYQWLHTYRLGLFCRGISYVPLKYLNDCTVSC